MLLRLPEGLEKKQEQKTLSANAKKKKQEQNCINSYSTWSTQLKIIRRMNKKNQV